MRIIVFAVAFLAACGGSGGTGAPTAEFGLERRTSPTTVAFPFQEGQSTTFARQRSFPALSFERPVFLTHAGDGTDRIFVVEQAGRIHVFQNDDAVASAAVFLDIRDRVSRERNEEGLLGLAFDPDFASNGHFFVYYSAANPRRSIVARFTASGNVADPASETLLLTWSQPFSNHNGGALAFGPDGMLYVASGDGGSGGDPLGNGQTIDTFLGKLLRVRADGAAPADNPFFTGGGTPRDFVWAYGLRNPWRFSFDRATGELWVADVGQNAWEEIDVVEKGGNYGWNVFEGFAEFENPSGLPSTDFALPIAVYGHDVGASITGGYVYRGARLAGTAGTYFYADFISGRVWALVRTGGTVVSNDLVASIPNPSSFGEDESGELYVCSFDGSIYHLEKNAPSPSTVPATLSQSGLFADLATLRPAAGVIEYGVRAPQWADGATIRRWIAVPGNATIAFDDNGTWDFPAGTVFVQHFGFPGRRVETRVLVRQVDGWAAHSYRWNASGTDADLLTAARNDVLDIGGVAQTWTYPGPTDCLRCHNENAGVALGVRTAQLNGDFPYAARTDNQLRAWNHVGLFDRDIGPASAYDAIPDPRDASIGVEARARAYLESNCSFCHRPGGPTPVDMDLRRGVAEADMNVIDVAPTESSLGLPDERRVAPGVRTSSTLWERLRRRDGFKMPPVGSNVADAGAVELIGGWIDSR